MPSEEPVAEAAPVPPIDPNLRIIYQNDEGGVSIVIPSVDCGLTIEQIAIKDVPNGATFRIVDVSSIPSDRTFRGAWEHGASGVTVSVPKAKAIHLGRLRALRAPKLAELDVAFVRALEQGDTAAQARIAAQKQALRDVTKLALPDDLNALKNFKPDILS